VIKYLFINHNGIEMSSIRIRSYLIFIIFITAFFYNCINQKEISRIYFKISIKEKILRIQDSTSIDLKINDYNGSNLSINWSTDDGYIKGAGTKVKYFAPDHRGLAKIKVKIIDRSNTIYLDSIDIIIYKQLIFLKADDLRYDSLNLVSTSWKLFIDYIESEKIKASLGLIGNSLENGNETFYSYLKVIASSGFFEIWNHGYDHLLNGINENGVGFDEFFNTSFEYQKDHILKTQLLAKEKLNITIHTFGAPGNYKDSSTLKAVEGIDDIKVWYFGFETYSKLNLERVANIEFPYFNPNFQKFLENYDTKPCWLALQIHPATWDENRFSEFRKIINFLEQEDVTFMNPFEYYQLRN
jgi:Uncharacterized protein conserved in bacteria (DUF2334)